MNVLARNVQCASRIVGNLLLKNNNSALTTRSVVTFKSDLKIKWTRPEKICCTRPEKSGDGGIKLKVTPQDLNVYFEKSKELENADPIVKKMFSLEFSPKKETRNKEREEILALVKRHGADRGSVESRIATMTSEILYLQEHMVRHPRNKKVKVFLKELIDKRKKFLSKMRIGDYKKFEWLLDKLNIVYKPHPPLYLPITRKGSMRRLTAIHCKKIKNAKLTDYRRELKVAYRGFIKEKAEKLKFIRQEEIACGVEPTVTEEEIANAERTVALRLQWEEKRK